MEVLTARGLIRYFVLFVIDLETRRVEIAGIVHQPYEDWMKQIPRNLTDAMDGFLRTTRFLIHDRDPLFSASFRATLSPAGVETVKLPARSPNLNAHTERCVRSIKHECLNRMIPLGENHLRTAVRAYVAHYHLERNHQGLDNRLISEAHDRPCTEGSVLCRERVVCQNSADAKQHLAGWRLPEVRIAPLPRTAKIRPMPPLALTFAGWVNRSQQDAIEYLKEENRVLREQLGAHRLRFTNDQRRRLAAKAKAM